MTCVICKNGTPEGGKTTLTLEREGTLVVFRRVPANICPNCGESYIDQEVVEQVYREADEAVHAGVEIDVREFHPITT